jgi:hypothetical protein
VASIAVPPEEIVSVPPLSIVAALTVPPTMYSKPPRLIVVLTASPPMKTLSEPPLLTVVPTAEPPEETLIVPPLSTAPLIVPPDKTLSVPPLSTVHPLAGEPEDTPEICPPLTVVMALPPCVAVWGCDAVAPVWNAIQFVERHLKCPRVGAAIEHRSRLCGEGAGRQWPPKVQMAFAGSAAAGLCRAELKRWSGRRPNA